MFSVFKVDQNELKVDYCTIVSNRESEGLSGRTLRKIPFLAHALYAQVGITLSFQ